jgi:orotidine-5'-phosphate decarboxylase
MYVITDGKRNDIGSSMESYAIAHLGKVSINGDEIYPFTADALTVNGYFGSDGIEPLVEVCRENGKGFFIVVKSSNPSSGEIQDKLVDTEQGRVPVYRIMAELCREVGEKLPGKYGYNGAGAVVGATYPEQIAELRELLPNTFFLIPGFGVQGGNAKDVSPAFDENGLGGIVNNSRGIITAYIKENADPKDFAGAARRAAEKMREELIEVTGTIKADKKKGLKKTDKTEDKTNKLKK